MAWYDFLTAPLGLSGSQANASIAANQAQNVTNALNNRLAQGNVQPGYKPTAAAPYNAFNASQGALGYLGYKPSTTSLPPVIGQPQAASSPVVQTANAASAPVYNPPQQNSIGAPPGMMYDGQGNLVPQSTYANSGQTTPFNVKTPDTVNASDINSNGYSYQDILKSIGQNIQAYQTAAQKSDSEKQAEQAYLQAVAAQQNFGLSLTGGKLAQYGVGRPLSLDTGRAAQLDFNNQLNTLGYQNAADIAQRQLGYEQTSRQANTTAAQGALSANLALGGQALQAQQLQQQLALATLPYSNMTQDQKAQLGLSYYQATGQFPDFSSTLSPSTHSSVSTVQGNNIFGYDLSSYATDPQHTDKVLANLQQIPQNMTTSTAAQAYINQTNPNSPITGQMLYNASTTYGVPMPLLTALMQEESGLGTQGLGAKTMNPGNVGNTDSGATRRFSNWQDGVNATAKWLADHYTGEQDQNGVPVTDIINQVKSYFGSPALQQAVQAMPNGMPYINLGLVPSSMQAAAANIAGQHGIKAFNENDAKGIQALGNISQALNQMTELSTNQLSPANGGVGTATNAVKNWWGTVRGTNSELSNFAIFKDSAIKAVQALAGGAGSGLRLNTGTIDAAVSNLPTMYDSQEVALEKINKTRDLLNIQFGQIFGNSDLSKGVIQHNGHTYMPGDIVSNGQGGLGVVNADGSITPQ